MPVPVYHPTFMDQVLRLLRAKCRYCHHLKMSRKEVNRYLCKLRLIQHGLLGAAEEVDNIEVSQTKDEENTSGSEEESDVDSVIRRRNAFVKRIIKAAKADPWEWKREKNEAVAEARRTVVKAFMKAITTGRVRQERKTRMGLSKSWRRKRDCFGKI